MLWRFNRSLFAKLLMQASRESLQKLLADPKYLGATPGIISALHTWGRNLSIHPHVHCLVTAGGVDRSGRFIEQQRSTLLPARVLMIVFRGRLRSLLKSAIANGELVMPRSLTVAKSQSLLNRLGRTNWNVRIQERYRHGVSVAGYLARYIAGGPMSDRRLQNVTGTEVAFRYRDYRGGQDKVMRLKPHEFLARWFEHVPPRGLRMIRRSGLYANCHAGLRRAIRGEAASSSPQRTQPRIRLDPERCPECNNQIVTTELSCPIHQKPTNNNHRISNTFSQPP
ncbi:transposase [bacterium]|nr:transposase [bacterium]